MSESELNQTANPATSQSSERGWKPQVMRLLTRIGAREMAIVEWGLRACLFLVLLSTCFPWFINTVQSSSYTYTHGGSGFSGFEGGPNGEVSFTAFGAATMLSLLIFLGCAAAIATSFIGNSNTSLRKIAAGLAGLVFFLVLVTMIAGKPSTIQSSMDVGFGGWDTTSAWHLRWGAWFAFLFGAASVGLAAVTMRDLWIKYLHQNTK